MMYDVISQQIQTIISKDSLGRPYDACDIDKKQSLEERSTDRWCL